jgi:predicted lipoprotein
MIKRFASVLLIACAGVSAACAQAPSSVPPPPADVLTRMTISAVDTYILGALDRWKASTAGYGATLAQYCRAPSADGRTELRTGFADLLVAWAGVDFLQFGPLARDARADRYAFWPDPHGTGERQLRQFLAQRDPAILAPGALAKQSAAVQGLPALERLVFDGSDALASAATPIPFRCDLAKAVAANLGAIADAVVAEWQGDRGWRALMLAPTHDNPVYIKADEPVVELMKALISGLERLSDQRISPARGPMPQAARASRAPYAMSGATPAYWRASADSLTRFAEALGLTGLVPPDKAAMASDAATQWTKLHDALAAAGNDLEAALTSPGPRAKLGDALTTLQRLKTLFGTEIPATVGLTTGFNALDGD